MKLTKSYLRTLIKEAIANGQGMGPLFAAARALIEDAKNHMWNTGDKPTHQGVLRYIEESEEPAEVKDAALGIIG